MPQITCSHPAISGNGFGGFFWLMQIALHYIIAAHQYLASLISRAWTQPVIGYHYLITYGDPRRSYLAGMWRQGIGQDLRACLGQPHGFDNRDAKPGFKLAMNFRGQRRRCRARKPQPVLIDIRCRIIIQKIGKKGRYRAEPAGIMGVDILPKTGQGKPVGHHQPATRHNCAHHRYT